MRIIEISPSLPVVFISSKTLKISIALEFLRNRHVNTGCYNDLIIVIKELNGTNGMIREGENLLLKLKISLVEALCGVNKIIKH